MRTVTIDPITRIEGHLRVEIEVADGMIVRARSSGALFRGIELILLGRYPLDAQRITTRICGVCPLAHSTASSFCLDSALGISEKIPKNSRLLRNLIFGANFLHNHILHFYHLALPDYLDPRGSPLEGLLYSPEAAEDCRFSSEENRKLVGHYVEALDMRRKAQELVALFGGKMPHDMAIVPGGVTYRPTPGDVAAYRFRLEELRAFIMDVYVPDVILLAKRYQDYFEVGKVGRLLSYGGFPEESGRNLEERLFPPGVYRHGSVEPLDPREIREAVARSWYEGDEAHPSSGQTRPTLEKQEAYSWIKAPRYRGEAFEVGPAARMAILLARGKLPLKSHVEELLKEVGIGPESLSSVMGRHVARAIEATILVEALKRWLSELDLAGPVAVPFEIPDVAEGEGLAEAPRGGVGHWIRIESGRIAHYQVISPTTWNASPRDGQGKPGPIEEALEGTKVRGNGMLEAGRIVRSFDPCLACAVQ